MNCRRHVANKGWVLTWRFCRAGLSGMSEVGLSESVPVFLGKAWFYNCVQATKWGLFSFRITELSQLLMPLMRSVIE